MRSRSLALLALLTALGCNESPPPPEADAGASSPVAEASSEAKAGVGGEAGAEAGAESAKAPETPPPPPPPPPECLEGDLVSCGAACGAGNATACMSVGDIHEHGKHEKTIDYPAARAAYQAACDLGEADGCAGVGFGYLTGLGADEDLERAHKLFADACTRGSGLGCHGMAWIVFDGRREPFDWKRIHELDVKACELGELQACADAGGTFLHGKGVPKDEVKARTYFERSCTDDAHFGCSSLAWGKVEGTLGMEKDPAAAVAELRRLCELPSPGACGDLAYLLQQGTGAAQDLAAAREKYRYACEHGGIHQCADLGSMVLRGEGGPADLGQALELLEGACNRNASGACYTLAHLYLGSPYLPNDLGKAQAYLEQACAAEHPWACLDLGNLHYNDLDAHPRDLDKAIASLAMGCEAGAAKSCANVAILLEPGDPARARELAIEGCEGGESQACTQAKRMLIRGQGGPADPARAITMLEAGCKPEAPKMCELLARSYLSEAHESGNAEKGVELLQQLCDAAKPFDAKAKVAASVEAGACYALGGHFMSGHRIALDETRAAALMQRGCDLGVPHACANLAYEYETSRRLEQDFNATQTLFARACELEAFYCLAHAEALTRLPIPPGDPAKGIAYLEGVCSETKARTGCDELAGIYEEGNDNVAKDEAKAIAYFDKACAYDPGEHRYKGGVAKACYNAGHLRLGSEDPALQQRDAALAALERGCEFGKYSACDLIADTFQASSDAAEVAKAADYRAKACTAGNMRSCQAHEGH